MELVVKLEVLLGFSGKIIYICLMENCKIYVLIDPTTNEIKYVGKTINEKERYKNHLNPKHNEKTHKRNWINKLRNNNLKPIFKVIEEVLITDDWRDREKYWISHYRLLGFNLVNHSDGGEGLDFKGNQTSFKENHISWNKDKGNTEICIVCNTEFKLSKAQVKQGRKTCSHECGSTLKQTSTKSTQFKLGQKVWNKGGGGYKTSKRIPIVQLDLNNNLIKEWECCQDAAKEFKCLTENIRRACVGLSKTAKGFKWEYKHNYNKIKNE